MRAALSLKMDWMPQATVLWAFDVGSLKGNHY